MRTAVSVFRIFCYGARYTEPDDTFIDAHIVLASTVQST